MQRYYKIKAENEPQTSMEIKTLGKNTQFCLQRRLKLKTDISNSIKRNLEYD